MPPKLEWRDGALAESLSLSDWRWERKDVEEVVLEVRMVRVVLFFFDFVDFVLGLSIVNSLVDLTADLATSEGSWRDAIYIMQIFR